MRESKIRDPLPHVAGKPNGAGPSAVVANEVIAFGYGGIAAAAHATGMAPSVLDEASRKAGRSKPARLRRWSRPTVGGPVAAVRKRPRRTPRRSRICRPWLNLRRGLTPNRCCCGRRAANATSLPRSRRKAIRRA